MRVTLTSLNMDEQGETFPKIILLTLFAKLLISIYSYNKIFVSNDSNFTYIQVPRSEIDSRLIKILIDQSIYGDFKITKIRSGHLLQIIWQKISWMIINQLLNSFLSRFSTVNPIHFVVVKVPERVSILC